MTSEFPLLSAVLEQSLGPLPPARDIGRVLGALGIAGASYHSFEPPQTPEAPPTEARSSEQPVPPQTIADNSAVETAHADVADRQPAPAVPIKFVADAADPLWPEKKSHELSRDAQVWTTPTLGIPKRTEPRVMAQAAPAPFVHAMAEHAPDDAQWNRHPAEPEHPATRPASAATPDHGSATVSQRPIRQQLSLSGLFRILGSPTPTPAAPSRTLRDVFGYANKRNS